MSIGYSKISEMIEQEINSIDGLPDDHRKLLKDLCNKVYLLRGSAEYRNRSRFKDEIMGEVSRAADALRTAGG